MNLLDLLETDKYPKKFSYHSDLLVVYQRGGLGEFYASKFYNDYYGKIPNPIMKTNDADRTDVDHNDYIKFIPYTKQLWTPYAYWLWDINVLRPLIVENDVVLSNKLLNEQYNWCKKKSQIFNGWPELPTELLQFTDKQPKNWLLSHIPPILSSKLYNLTFKKTIFIRPRKERDSILKFRISEFRGEVNEKSFYSLYTGGSVKDYMKMKINYNDTNLINNTIEFSDWWLEGEQIIKDRSEIVETIYFDDILNINHDHTNKVKEMVLEIKHFLDN